MRRPWVAAAGLGLAAILVAGAVQGRERVTRTGGKASQPAVKKDGQACGSHGTSIDFVDTPVEAARLAKEQKKLVFVLHVSGNFEDPRFT